MCRITQMAEQIRWRSSCEHGAAKKTARSPQPLTEGYYRKVNAGSVRTRGFDCRRGRMICRRVGKAQACPPSFYADGMVGTALCAFAHPTKLRIYPRRTLDPPSTGNVTPVIKLASSDAR